VNREIGARDDPDIPITFARTRREGSLRASSGHAARRRVNRSAPLDTAPAGLLLDLHALLTMLPHRRHHRQRSVDVSDRPPCGGGRPWGQDTRRGATLPRRSGRPSKGVTLPPTLLLRGAMSRIR